MTGSGYTVEHRHFENCCSISLIAVEDLYVEIGNLLNSETMAFQLDISKPGYSWNNLACKCPPRRLSLAGWVCGPDY